MNILEEFPKVYYINLDNRTDRREYMESQFDYWGIKDYHRVSASKYLASDYESWKHLVLEDRIIETETLMSTALNHITTIIDWYDNNESETCIIMEDDLSLDNIRHWNFDWKFFKNNIPETWESIQLYFCREDFIPMYLHKRIDWSCSAAAYMINRSYAKKVKNLMYVDNKYKLTLCDNSYTKKYRELNIIADANLFDIGVTFSIPLFSINYNFVGDNSQNKNMTNVIDIRSSKVINHWWKNEHHNYKLDDFFTHGKPNDIDMIRGVKF